MTPDDLRNLLASDEVLAPDADKVLAGVHTGIHRRKRRGQAVIGAAVVLALVLAGTAIAQPWQGGPRSADDRLAGVTTPSPSPSATPSASATPSPTPSPSPSPTLGPSEAASPAPSAAVPVPRAPSAVPSTPPKSPTASPSPVDARPTVLASGLRIGPVDVPLGTPYSQARKRLDAALGTPTSDDSEHETPCPGSDIRVLTYDSGTLVLLFASADTDGNAVAGEPRLYTVTVTGRAGSARTSTRVSADGLALSIGSTLADIRAGAKQRRLGLRVTGQMGPFEPTVELTTSGGGITGILNPDTSDGAEVVEWLVGGGCGD